MGSQSHQVVGSDQVLSIESQRVASVLNKFLLLSVYT